MKKILLLVTIVLLGFTLAACDDKTDGGLKCPEGQVLEKDTCVDEPVTCETGKILENGICVDEPVTCGTGQVLENDVCVDELSNEDKIIAAKTALEIDAPFELMNNITMPSEILHGVEVVWESNNATYLAADGTVVRAIFEDGNQYVTLKATLTFGGITTTKSFNFVVISEELYIAPITDDVDVVTDADAITFGDNNISERLSLPRSGTEGSSISWESSNERLISTNGFVNRPGFFEGDELVTLTATVVNGDFTETRNFVVTVVAEEENLVTSVVTFPFENISTEYTVDTTELDVYFMNNGALPYVDVQEFINSLEGAIVSEEMVIVADGDSFRVSVIYTEEGEPDYEVYTLFDFTLNTMEVNDFAIFDGVSVGTSTDFGSGLTYIGGDSTDPEMVYVDFDDYDFDLVMHEGKYLLPFHLANQFFSTFMYNAYYNGDTVYGIDSYQFSDVEAEITDSSFNALEMPNDVREASYDFTAFVYDYFYGLKEDQEIDTYYDELEKYYTTFTTRDDTTSYKSVFRFAYSRDDLHTYHTMAGFYEDGYSLSVTLNDLGPNSQDFYESSWALEDACDAKQPYRIIDGGKVAIIYIEGFTAEAPDEFGASLAAVQAAGTVESIVVDLTCNGGGILGTMWQIMGYMTEDPITYYSRETTDGSTGSGSYDSDNDAELGVDWYVLTSPSTFSAANLMASMTKDMGVATIIGQQSSGGGCSVASMIVPGGSIVQHSSTGMLTNSRYESIDGGIPVDFEMDDVNSETELLAIINGN